MVRVVVAKSHDEEREKRSNGRKKEGEN